LVNSWRVEKLGVVRMVKIIIDYGDLLFWQEINYVKKNGHQENSQ